MSALKEARASDDPSLVSRVKKYLEDNIDKTFLDVDEMSTTLQKRYSEYANKPPHKFRKTVEQAYRVVSLSYGLDCQASSNDDSDGSDIELMDDSTNSKRKNMMANIIKNLYSKKVVGKESNNTRTTDGEAIDISSDDEDDDNKGKEENSKKVDGIPATKSASDPKIPAGITVTNVSKNSSTNGNSNGNENIPVGKKRRDIGQADGQSSTKRSLNPQQLLQNIKANQAIPPAIALKNSRLYNDASSGVQQSHKKYKKIVAISQSQANFQHIGGMEKQLKELCEILIHLKVPDIYFELGVMPPRGILIHGPSGCGKSLLASAIAGQMGAPFIIVPATELIAGVSGESEERIRDIFEQASLASPCVLFIDEIDAISSNRLQAQKDMERRVVSQLISSIDSLHHDYTGYEVLVIGATTRPDSLDPALRRAGRFDHEIAIPIPNRKERKEILRVVCDGLRIDHKFDFDKIAELTPGYVGADLSALATRAASIAVKNKWSEHMHKLKGQRKITIVDLDDIDEVGDSNEKKKNNNKENKTNNIDADMNTDEVQDKNEKDMLINTTENEEVNVNGNKLAAIQNSNESEKMDIDREENTAKSVEENPEIETKEIRTLEPTLAEMINWLDSPPEDFQLDDFFITLDDFCEAVKILQPSAKREGFITVPDVTWDDIGSLHDIREELRLAILAPVKYPDKMERLGLEAPSGVLLCGPPGCGKTLIAKAVANEAGINFISVKGPELMNMYVGESERAVRDCFQRARNSAPCVIFFDEFDSLCPKRSQTSESSSGTRIVNQLLTEMDGIQERKGVYIMAATNRPDIIDPAILRPGRLDTILYVGLPETNDRYEILEAATKNRKTPVLAKDVDLMELARKTNGFTGADLTGLIRHAAMLALKQSLDHQVETDEMCVHMKNFEEALSSTRPSISDIDRKNYEILRQKYAAPRHNSESGKK